MKENIFLITAIAMLINGCGYTIVKKDLWINCRNCINSNDSIFELKEDLKLYEELYKKEQTHWLDEHKRNTCLIEKYDKYIRLEDVNQRAEQLKKDLDLLKDNKIKWKIQISSQ